MLGAFVRASSLHIGAAAAAAFLRDDLAKEHHVPARDIDAAYAVSRITPGTNLLALYALLGHRLGGWSLAVQAVAVGAVIPALIVVAIAVLYTHYSTPIVAALMTGARAGGVAVFLGAAVRLLKPQVVERPRIAIAFALVAFTVAWMLPVRLFLVLVLAGAGGALFLRPTT